MLININLYGMGSNIFMILF